ncbi:protein-L-isoaspartate O-methyltransferase [Bacterioplanes sanyensis]|uniref:Protein-L-isoaspartate O-methyltransferase n=1 Tax=Bacterioplanes sanyensis TaxID=1249553 RepID=A0A222FQ14_9GAMM|nr:protein-L-isoaspartate(D-aspartate) O-methyltransferase [Bacterioplanes sanyensis]ASP40870.1 protein-L-isoaspartate O-methyltransferase [Bacterioplanes sanyensis]
MTSQRTRNRLIQRLRQAGIANEQVLSVMANTPRHMFVDEALGQRAYEDTALPIGHGQTISQPYTVARMTEVLLQGGPCNKVLEIGTGSGYQTAILSPLVTKVYSVERIAALQKKAQQRIRQLKLRNVSMKLSDGGWGWPEVGPFDGILAAAAPETVPPTLLEQLAQGGRLVIPIGGDKQILMLITRTDGGFEHQELEAVNFVPFLPGVLR